MEELWSARAILDPLVDILVEQVFVEERLRQLLQELDSQLGAFLAQVDLLDQQGQTRV